MTIYHPYTVFPLGDTALTIEFGNIIDEAVNDRVIRFFQVMKKGVYPFVLDLVPAYCSLTIYYDLVMLSEHVKEEETVFDWMVMFIENLAHTEAETVTEQGRMMEIPVCYSGNFAPDIAMLADVKGLSVEEVIRLHTAATYKIYMIGFLPGFAYMGQVDEQIAFPRKAIPKPVVPGAVGIAGRQTGIYPLQSPGGWQIIGRTPLALFNKQKDDPVYLQAGDRVRFHSITEDEFTHYQGGSR